MIQANFTMSKPEIGTECAPKDTSLSNSNTGLDTHLLQLEEIIDTLNRLDNELHFCPSFDKKAEKNPNIYTGLLESINSKVNNSIDLTTEIQNIIYRIYNRLIQ